MSVKIERLENIIIREVSMILANEIKDKDIKFVTITDCKLTNDLSFAKLYITVLDDSKRDVTLKALKDAAHYMRKELASRIDIRHTPQLIFVYDESIEYGKKIDNLIEKIHEDK